jgi:hypothetical protein
MTAAEYRAICWRRRLAGDVGDPWAFFPWPHNSEIEKKI